MKSVLLGAAALVVASVASAQETDIGDAISIELNAAQNREDGCVLSFLVMNGYETPIEQVIYEVVLFDLSGQVDQLTLFDFGALPPARARVRQFVMPGASCADFGGILFNGAHTCMASGADVACEGALSLTTRTAIEVQG